MQVLTCTGAKTVREMCLVQKDVLLTRYVHLLGGTPQLRSRVNDKPEKLGGLHTSSNSQTSTNDRRKVLGRSIIVNYTTCSFDIVT